MANYFCYKMFSIINDLKSMACDQDFIQLKNTVQRFAIYFGISILTSFSHTLSEILSNIFQSNNAIYCMAVISGAADLYTNAICTVLTYQGARIFPTKTEFYNFYSRHRAEFKLEKSIKETTTKTEDLYPERDRRVTVDTFNDMSNVNMITCMDRGVTGGTINGCIGSDESWIE